MMTYRDLLAGLEMLEKKDSLLAVFDRRLVSANLGYFSLPMTRYDNGKLVQTINTIRVSGVPVEDLPEKNYLCIVSAFCNDFRLINTTVKIKPFANEWVEFLKALPDYFLNQEILFYSYFKEYAANAETAMKGGIGISKHIGIAYREKIDYFQTTRSNVDQEYRISLKRYCDETGCTPFYWGEAVIFDMNQRNMDIENEVCGNEFFVPLNER